MSNTITQRTLVGSGADRHIVRHIHIVSDGSEETDLVIYDNSAFINDVNKGVLEQIYVMGDVCNVRLEWDQTADSPIMSIDPSGNDHFDFRCFGGIPNPGGTGATGDIVMTTADLDSGDEVTIIIVVKQ